LCLLFEDLLCLIAGCWAIRLYAYAERADCCGNVDTLSRRLDRYLHGLAVYIEHLLFQPVFGQLDGTGAERVGLDQLCPCFYVLFMDVENQPGIREVHLIEAAIDIDALRIEHRAHCAVEDTNTIVLESIFEIWH